MCATVKWLVLRFNEDGTRTVPLCSDDGKIMLWETEEEADSAGLNNPLAKEFGFFSYKVGD